MTHVDDLFLGYNLQNARAVEMRSKMNEELKFGKYQTGSFVHFGREYAEAEDFSIPTNMEAYLNAMATVGIAKGRKT